MKSQYWRLAFGLITSFVVNSASAQRVDLEVQKILGQSFQAKGIAGLDRLVQDENQALARTKNYDPPKRVWLSKHNSKKLL